MNKTSLIPGNNAAVKTFVSFEMKNPWLGWKIMYEKDRFFILHLKKIWQERKSNSGCCIGKPVFTKVFPHCIHENQNFKKN